MLPNIVKTDFSSREEWLEDRIKTYNGETLRIWADRSVCIFVRFLCIIQNKQERFLWSDDVDSFVKKYAPHYKDEFDGKR